LLHRYPDKVRLVVMNAPLSSRAESQSASFAAVAAQNQGQFWEMLDLLFDHQATVSPDAFVTWAGQLGLDARRFQADMASAETHDRVRMETALGLKVGAMALPGFLIDNRLLPPTASLDDLTVAVDHAVGDAAAVAEAEAPLNRMAASRTERPEVGNSKVAPPIGADDGAQVDSDTPPTPEAADRPIDWNDRQIAWVSLDEAVAAARIDPKPICLVVYAEWCPHCHKYSSVFHDAKVVKKAKQLIMVRMDADKDEPAASRYAPDGGYVPRTFFLDSVGKVRKEVLMRSQRYAYFYPESDPAWLLRSMNAALEKPRGR
jgi:thiol-disulfide isomerase/thioredoxin